MKEFFKNLLKWPVKRLVIANAIHDKRSNKARFRISLAIVILFVALHIFGAMIGHEGFKGIAWGMLLGMVGFRAWWVEYASRKDKYYIYLADKR